MLFKDYYSAIVVYKFNDRRYIMNQEIIVNSVIYNLKFGIFIIICVLWLILLSIFLLTTNLMLFLYTIFTQYQLCYLKYSVELFDHSMLHYKIYIIVPHVQQIRR